MLALCVSLMAGCEEPPPPREPETKNIKVFEVGSASPISGREYYGTAKASRAATLSFRFGGRLTETPIRDGQQVEEGDVLARLDDSELSIREAQTLSELDGAQAVLTQMQAGARAEDVRRLEAIVSGRVAEQMEASATPERLERLFESGVAARQELDQARLKAEQTRTSLDAARQELEIARAGARDEEVDAQRAVIRGLEARLTEVRDDLEDAVLRAPFDGVVAQTFVSNFEDVQANQPIASLQDLSKIDVVINVSEEDMARGTERANGTIDSGEVIGFATVSALGGASFPLTVKEFETQADSATQTFRVTLQMTQEGGFPVKPGMNVIVRGQGADALGDAGGFLSPVSAIGAGPDGATFVWVVDPETNRVEKRPVETGEIWDDKIVIRSGVTSGDKIAASAVTLLREGMTVQPMKPLEDL